jgi:hypothetical protein
MSIEIGLVWDSIETPTYKQLEHVWSFSPEYEESGYSDEGSYSTQQSSRYKVTHHFSNGYITKLYDNEVNEFFYCITNYFPNSAYRTSDWSKFVSHNATVNFYPNHYEVTPPRSTGGSTIQTSLTGIRFWAIPWKEFIPSGFVYEKDLQDESFSTRAELVNGHSRDLVDKKFYKFSYDGTPLNEEQFTVPKKYKVNRKKMKALRQGKLQKIKEYISAMWNIYPDSWSKEDANDLWLSACKSDNEEYRHLICALMRENYNRMPEPDSDKLKDSSYEFFWGPRAKRSTPDQYLNSLERSIKQQHYKDILELVDEPQRQLAI